MENPTEFFQRIWKYLELFRNLYSISSTPESEPDIIIYELYSSASMPDKSNETQEIINIHNLQSPPDRDDN